MGSCFLSDNRSQAKDYIVVIAGGPNKEQNQASMEANVLFFLKLVEQQSSSDRELSIFFADGPDPGRDVQYVQSVSSSERSASSNDLRDLLRRLNRRGGRGPGMGLLSPNRQRIGYRNHQIPNAESTNPELIRSRLESIAGQATSRDRVLIYVTAHGSSDKESDYQNTSIACWGGEIRVKEMSEWLKPLSSDVPVYLVMAQCYTGGFANLVFNRPSSDDFSLSQQSYIGFFAQQFDLPAAGCRPDVEVDEEYSSYYWGAMLGEMRNGQAISDADLNLDGRISFGEAHAHAMAYSQTIDIPLRSSDRLLRQFSLIPGYISESEDQFLVEEEIRIAENQKLMDSKNTIQRILESATVESAHVVKVLANELKIPLEANFESMQDLVKSRKKALRDEMLSANKPDSNSSADTRDREESRPARRGPAGRSGRRELLAAIVEKFPELEPAIQGRDRSVFESIDQKVVLDEIKQFPEYQRYERYLKEAELEAKIQAEVEMLEVKMRRLTETLELILLANNLEQIAAPEVVVQFNRIRSYEADSLSVKD